jgi:protein-tyrosine-phosphatase
MPPRVFNVLFVCAGESARGLIAQALLNRLAPDRFQAWCATGDCGEIHPQTIDLLKAHRLWNGERCMRWEQFTGIVAPEMDFVISVGDKLPESVWNRFPNYPVKAQWRITDPASLKGDPMPRKAVFRRSVVELENRIKLFVLVWGSPKSRTLAA